MTRARLKRSALSFGKDFTIILTKTGDTTASAHYRGSNGDFTAELTRR